MSELEPMPPAKTTAPSLLAANTFLLLGIGIIMVVSRYLSDLLPPFWMSSLAEFALAAITLVFIRAEKLPIKKTLRLQWPGWHPVALSALLAIGVWLVSVSINVMAMLVLGYAAPATPSAFPKNIGGALALVIATTISAPLCEEIMFRGYIQRAYERWGAWPGILISGGIFAIYHLRFQGVFALMPVALLLGFVAWRSQSLWPGIILHATYNAIASLLIVAMRFLPMQILGILVAMILCLALLLAPVALIGLWWFWKATPSPARIVAQKMVGWRRWVWSVPLVILLVVYGYFAFAEIIVGRFPEALAQPELALTPPFAWEQPQQWTYAIHNRLNEDIGEAACSLESQATAYRLVCSAEQQASSIDFPIDIPQLNDMFNVEARAWEQRTLWDNTTLQLQTMVAEQDAGQVKLTVNDAHAQAENTVSIPAEALLADEWPWRLGQIPFEIGYGAMLPYVWLDATGQIQISEAYVGVVSGESIWTPAGNFVAWKVELVYESPEGDEVTLTAWYAEDGPHTLVGYNDTQVTYLLADNN